MRSVVRACSMLLMTCALLADSASARDYLNCLTKKVVIVDAASGSTSSKTEEKPRLLDRRNSEKCHARGRHAAHHPSLR